MKIIESWLREWIDIPLTIEQIAQQLTLAGLEVAEICRSGANFSGVVVGEVVDVQSHPDAERLRVCKVVVGDIAKNEPLTIVCGASNVRIGLKAPVALCGAVLPGDIKIKKTKLRGIESSGMMCSAKELNLAQNATGLMELAEDAPVGIDIKEYLKLNDAVLEIELTANRGDCLSVLGIVRELVALNNLEQPLSKLESIKTLTTTSFPSYEIPINLSYPEVCSNYAGCVLLNINNKNKTPPWMVDRLEKSGLRSVSPVVDVTNYVMLELGQPLHAFALNKINGGIIVRNAKSNEKIITLDNKELELTSDELVIADENKVLAIAGVIGGLDSAVNENTTNIFLESAYFDAENIRKTTQRLGLTTDASYRFERGVDPDLQALALMRARQLLLEVSGGQAHAIVKVVDEVYLPQSKEIKFLLEKVNKLLGTNISVEKIVNILKSLGMKVDVHGEELKVIVPSYRFDINIAEDVIEEIARVYGYDALYSQAIVGEYVVKNKMARENISERDIKKYLVGRGYCEAITYSFVEPHLQKLLDPSCLPQKVINPIASELSVMRTSLWPGLIGALQYNTLRQQDRIRLFEVGMCFCQEDDELKQKSMVAGIVLGNILPLQWTDITPRNVDFYDIKNDVTSMLNSFGYPEADIVFTKHEHPALHPKRCAAIYLQDNLLGYIGELHPSLRQELDIKQIVYLFELDLQILSRKLEPTFIPISKFPAVERDLAIIVNQDIVWHEIVQKVKESCSKSLQHVKIFDIYQGEGIDLNKKSMALRLRFQNLDSTLTDVEVDGFVNKVIKNLEKDLHVILRG